MNNTIYHFTYMVSCKSGKYYVGRHSTNDIDDGYLGSGKWITSLIDKTDLTREILEYYNTFEELVEAEDVLIKKHINNKLNMNFNNNPIGFPSGELHPNKDSKNNPMYGKKHSKESIQKMKQNRGNYKGENATFFGRKHSEEFKSMMSDLHKGKEVSAITRKKQSEAAKNRKRIKYKCPHCNIKIDPGNYAKYHGNKCKQMLGVE